MASHWGTAIIIIEEGLSARTTSLDDPNDPRLQWQPLSAGSFLPVICRWTLVIVHARTNDTKVLLLLSTVRPNELPWPWRTLWGRLGKAPVAW